MTAHTRPQRPSQGLRILVVMLHWHPYRGPLVPIYSGILRELMDRGHEITLITSFPHYRLGRSERWPEFRGKVLEIGEWRGVRLIRCFVLAPVFRSARLSLVFRALTYLSFNVTSVLAAVFLGGRPGIVLAPSSPPITNGLCAAIIGLIKRCPVVYNVQDIYPDMAVRAGIIGNRVLGRALRSLEGRVCRICARVVVLSAGMKGNLMEKGVPGERIEVVPNFADTEALTPRSKDNAFSREHGLVGRFIVMYAGNIGIPHGVEFIVRSAEILQGRRDILFCIVGWGEHREQVEALARELGLENVVFVPPQPEERVPDIWASGDVCLVTYCRGAADLSVPSKLLAIMASGRPVIAMADAQSEVSRLIAQAQCGLCVPPEEPHGLAQAILTLYADPEGRQAMGRRGRDHVGSHLGRKAAVDAFERTFEHLRAGRSGSRPG